MMCFYVKKSSWDLNSRIYTITDHFSLLKKERRKNIIRPPMMMCLKPWKPISMRFSLQNMRKKYQQKSEIIKNVNWNCTSKCSSFFRFKERVKNCLYIFSEIEDHTVEFSKDYFNYSNLSLIGSNIETIIIGWTEKMLKSWNLRKE